MSILGGNPNILLVIADDLGQDVVKIFNPFLVTRAATTRSLIPTTIANSIRVVTNDGTVEITGDLPNVSRFLRNGVYFEQAWAQPSCSPTRASIYTGLHPWKSGVGSPTGFPELDPSVSFTTVPELLPSEYVSGLFGKWHLGERSGTRPTEHGWHKHVGTLGGVLRPSYIDWDMVDSDNGYTPVQTTDYATWVTVREAAAWINAQDPATPWFATIAFHAPHDPFDIPPFRFYDPATAGDPATDAYKFNVMTQAMDHHIGRLIGTVSGGVAGFDFDPIPQAQLENTVILFIGDNGSPEEVAIQEEKIFIYEGSVRAPMICADGKAVVNDINSQSVVPRFLDPTKLGDISQELVHAVDLYQTIVRVADPAASGFPTNTDSNDLGPLFKDPGTPASVRQYNFAQWYKPGEPRATLRNSNYKLNYDAANAPDYSLYRYENGEIPNKEDDGTATNLYDAAVSGKVLMQTHLTTLMSFSTSL